MAAHRRLCKSRCILSCWNSSGICAMFCSSSLSKRLLLGLMSGSTVQAIALAIVTFLTNWEKQVSISFHSFFKVIVSSTVNHPSILLADIDLSCGSLSRLPWPEREYVRQHLRLIMHEFDAKPN